MKQRRVAWGLANVVITLLALAFGWWVIIHRQDIIDWWRLRGYTPSGEVAQLADQTTMTQRMRDLFYVSDPKVEDRDAFNADCQTTSEQGKVLGCYARQSIFIFNVKDARLAGVKQVTAAHETLHAAYERLDGDMRKKVDAMVTAQADALKNDKKLQDLIALYEKTEPGELKNELHSILGTQYVQLNPDLEAYYKQYFSDRAKVVAYQMQYNAEFDASQTRITDYQRQLETLKPQIDANNADLERRNTEINNESARLDQLRRTDVDAYNSEVPGFNAKIQEYNRVARATQALVAQYNAIVVKVKNEIALQSDLDHSLDSKYQQVEAPATH